MFRTLLTLLAAVSIVTHCDAAQGVRSRPRRQPAQKDEATEEKTNRVDIPEDVKLTLFPASHIDLVKGEDLTFECKIKNKPRDSQVQWYYMIRNKVDNTFDNFTILANEAATVNTKKYSVWTTPPNLYSLKIHEMKLSDTGEYCCFLYVSYSETYRQTTSVAVKDKQPPPTTARTTPPRITTAYPRYISRYGSVRGAARGVKQGANSKIDEIIEEAVEHDIESELGRKLNISMIKNNAKARTLIHNATEQIKSLLNFDERSGAQFNNGTTKLTITRRMLGVHSQVKTVVTTLISKISNVDSALAKALEPLRKGITSGQSDHVSKPVVSHITRGNAIPDWKKIYNEYKNGQIKSAATGNAAAAEDQSRYSNRISNTPTSHNDPYDNSEDELEIKEEADNTVDNQPITRVRSSNKASSQNGGSTKKCEYQLVINEFDPSQCPSIGAERGNAASMYYAGDNRKAAAFTQVPIGNVPTAPSNKQLARIEDRLIEEMANSKMVNRTVLMHDSMLHKTEKMLEEQTGDISKLEAVVKDLTHQLATSEEKKNDMEDKLTNVMLNILEVNKRLDVAMKRKGTVHFGKDIDVLSASETVTCDRHPNVTHYKDCSEIAEEEAGESGVYYIRPLYSACPIPVWCDMDTYPGGWTIVQRRERGATSFNRNWADYRKGFGHVTSEHWLGNDNLFLLSNQEKYMLRVDLWDFYDSRVFSEYRTFKIDGERDSYRLHISNYSGTAGDGLKTHNKQKFSTKDRDHDMWQDYHCAYEWEGGWWFTNCWSSYLNGVYYNVSNPPYNGISWREWKEEQLYMSEIKIRPVYQVRSDAPADEEKPESSESASVEEKRMPGQKDQPRHSVDKLVKRKYNKAVVGK